MDEQHVREEVHIPPLSFLQSYKPGWHRWLPDTPEAHDSGGGDRDRPPSNIIAVGHAFPVKFSLHTCVQFLDRMSWDSSQEYLLSITSWV